jgi:ribonuclease T
MIEFNGTGRLVRGATHSFHVQAFPGSNIEPAALQVNKIDPWHPLRPALDERDVLQRIFKEVRAAMQVAGCKRAILVGHNSWFDLSFVNAAVARAGVKRCPFHPFSSFDTATLGGAALGQTVLAKAVTIAGLNWDSASAHSATYDAERTAELFCAVCNELEDSFARAESRARELGWHESQGSMSDLAGFAADDGSGS